MPGAERAEIYFIAAMMVLILLISFASVYFFFRQYRKEMKQRESKGEAKQPKKTPNAPGMVNDDE
jgi:preprotein translocase subunit YajC